MRLRKASTLWIDTTFQSTHPVWDATIALIAWHRIPGISIHASRMGCDFSSAPASVNHLSFQSTHPVWDATFLSDDVVQVSGISIHASRMGCDHSPRKHDRRSTYFNPRIPYGMRLAGCGLRSTPTYFNPRIPYGMRHEHATGIVAWFISIHASRMGCDPSSATTISTCCYFNPRIPYGMRHVFSGRSPPSC